jgi:hypothetical protein
VISLLLHSFVDPFTRLGIGTPLGIVLLSWFFFIATPYVGYGLTFALVAMVGSLILSVVLHLLPREHHKPIRPSVMSIVLGVVAPCLFVFWFIYNSLFLGDRFVRGDVYGDLPWHLYLISSMVFGCNRDRHSLYDMTSPFYSGLPLAYPVMPNFISALMIRLFGSDYHGALYIPSLFFCFALFANLNAIVRRFCRGRLFEVACAPWLWIFMGGRGFLWSFIPTTDWHRPDFVHYWGGETYNFWFQNTAHVMLPQRSSLFGLPIAFSVVFLSMLLDFNKLDFRIFLSMGILVSSLPQVQPHSLIALFEFSIGLAVVNIRRVSVQWVGHFAIWGLSAFLLSLPQLFPYFSRTVGKRKGHFFEPMLLWNHRQRGPIGFWYDGLGPFIVLALFHGPLVADWQQLRWYLPALFVWTASNFILYQPWFMDNTKVFNAGWTAMAIAVVVNFLGKLWWIPRIMFIYFCCASGAIPIKSMYRNRGELWWDREAAWRLADWAKQNTDPKSIWVTAGIHAHPVVCLAGRQTFFGPYNWLSNHGIDPGEKYQVMDGLKRNPEDVARLDKWHIDYVCMVEGENHWPMRIADNSQKWKRLVKIGRYTVWERTDRPWLTR